MHKSCTNRIGNASQYNTINSMPVIPAFTCRCSFRATQINIYIRSDQIMLQTQHVRNSIVELLTAQWCRKGTSLTRESQLYFCLKKTACMHRSFQLTILTEMPLGRRPIFCDITDFYVQGLPLTLSAIAIL